MKGASIVLLQFSKMGINLKLRTTDPFPYYICSVSKVLEKIIYDKIIDFVSSKISTVQYGFLPNHSAVQQLLTMLDCIFKAYDMSSQTYIIFLDFKKAFDSVPHDELLLKLRKIGISGILWFWFRAYLKSRKQCICINGQFSDFLPVLYIWYSSGQYTWPSPLPRLYQRPTNLSFKFFCAHIC